MPGVSETRWSEYLRRSLGVRDSLSLTLQDEIFPVLPLASGADVEHRLIRGDRSWSGESIAVAAIGNFSWIVIENASTKDQPSLVIVDRVGIVQTLTTVQYHVALEDAVLFGTGGTFNLKSTRDTRRQPDIFSQRSIARIRQGQTAAQPAQSGRILTVGTAGDQVTDDDGWVLGPGSGVIVYSSAANTLVSGYFAWRERTIDVAEL